MLDMKSTPELLSAYLFMENNKEITRHGTAEQAIGQLKLVLYKGCLHCVL